MEKLRKIEKKKLKLYFLKKNRFSLLTKPQKIWLIESIERSIYNASFNHITNKNLSTFQNSKIFIRIYNTFCYKINSSIDSDSKTFSKYLEIGLFGFILNKHSEKLFLLKDKLGKKTFGYLYKVFGLKYSFDPNNIGFLNIQEIDPEKFIEIQKDIELRSKQKVEKKISKLFKCYNCGHRSTNYYSEQIRSFDEPSTLFITCTNCGNEWKKG